MAGNRKRHTNTVHVGSLMKWVVGVVFLGIVGLCFVYMSNQGHNRDRDISTLESQLKSLQVKNEEAEAKIAQLSSRVVLQRRLAEGFIKMKPITEDCIVRVAPPQHSTDEIRAVANRGIAK